MLSYLNAPLDNNKLIIWGHIISAQGIATDPAKWDAIESWPESSTSGVFLALPVIIASSPVILPLKKNGHPLAFISKSLGPKNQGMSTYDKEYMAILVALIKGDLIFSYKSLLYTLTRKAWSI